MTQEVSLAPIIHMFRLWARNCIRPRWQTGLTVNTDRYIIESDDRSLIATMEVIPVSKTWIVRLYSLTSDTSMICGFPRYVFPEPMTVMVFGSQSKAEEKMLELIVNPSWSILKYG